MCLNGCHIIGIDCATQKDKRGVAVARCEENRWIIKRAEVGLEDHEIKDVLTDCMRNDGRVLLALDAPLGWPKPLGCQLVGHMAGEKIPEKSDALFRRATDRFVKDTYDMQSLDVGADRIARTAHSALELLDYLGDGAIQLANNENFQGVSAIEVYPAATLKAHKLKWRGYKKSEDTDSREEILQGLKIRGLPDDIHSKAKASADVLDALVCILAGIDFLEGNVEPPRNIELARKEGWIWVRKKPFVMKCPDGEYGRVLEFVFPHESGGLCLMDVGRGLNAFNHPIHIVEMKTQESDRWILKNGAVIQELLPSDREWNNWQRWLDFRASPEGATLEDASTFDALKRAGAIL